MKYATLIVAFMLTGCSHYLPQVFRGVQTPTNPIQVTPSISSVFFVGAGQSNMAYEHLSDTFPNNANVAVGGTGIAQWLPGTTFYSNMVSACKSQKKQCVLLWWQGEANTTTLDYQDWGRNFLTIVDSLRHDLGYQIQVVYVQIGPNPGYPYWDDLKKVQASVENSRLMMTMVIADDMTPNTGDNLHYGQDQYKIMQGRMLHAWIKLTTGDSND